MATTMAMTMTTFGESRCWCQHQRQAHGSSGCGPNDLLMVTTKSGTAGAALAGLDNRGHLHVRSLRESGLLVGHEGYCPSQQREREQHHKQQRSVFTLVALAWPPCVCGASLVASLQVEAGTVSAGFFACYKQVFRTKGVRKWTWSTPLDCRCSPRTGHQTCHPEGVGLSPLQRIHGFVTEREGKVANFPRTDAAKPIHMASVTGRITVQRSP